MYSRWFNFAVVVLWLSTMSWLVTQKVLPPLLIGEPPSYRAIVESRRDEPPVGWHVQLDGRPLGYAISRTEQTPSHLTDIRSRVHFSGLPIRKLASGLIGLLLQGVELPLDNIPINVESTLTIDSLGRLVRFESRVCSRPGGREIRLEGTINGRTLTVEVHSDLLGDEVLPGAQEIPLPDDAVLADGLSPQTQLPGLHEGQTWSVPICNPLSMSGMSLEILQAKVESLAKVSWGGREVEAWEVVYRGDPGLGLGSKRRVRGRLWVRRDGTVLRQEAHLFNVRLAFVRMTESEATTLTERLGWDEPPEVHVP